MAPLGTYIDAYTRQFGKAVEAGAHIRRQQEAIEQHSDHTAEDYSGFALNAMKRHHNMYIQRQMDARNLCGVAANCLRDLGIQVEMHESLPEFTDADMLSVMNA